MRAEELRIGNLICSELNHRKEMKVLQLFSDSFQGEIGAERGAFMYSSFQGIALTEKILLNAGFKQDRIYKYRYEIGTFIVHKTFFMDTKGGRDGWALALDYGQQLASEIKYVHQLQNLYFALTGEELQIKT